jgi:1L-myo-inositol 1-phosphate cytidylyltransferase
MPDASPDTRVRAAAALPAVVLAAGNGSRLASSALAPKPLLQVGDRPLLGHVFDCLQAAGTTRVHVVVGFGADAICRHPALVPPGMDVEWLRNPRYTEANGLSLLSARRSVHGRFLLLMADHLLDPRTIVRLLRDRGETVRPVVAVDRKFSQVFDLDDATLVRESGGRVRSIGKRLDDANAVDTGLFLLTPVAFDAMDESERRGDRSLTGGMRILAERGAMDAWSVGPARWADVDTPGAAAHALDLLGQALVGSRASAGIPVPA